MMNVKEIVVDEKSPLFKKDGMFYKEFPSDFRQIRFFTLIIVQKAPAEIKEINLLEQQISELVKNAIKHGNKMDVTKKIKIWYFFNRERAHVIIEDEGSGFKEIEVWNEFNRKRSKCFNEKNFIEMEKYISFKSSISDEKDGGNALIAAVEYWDGGVVFNRKRNCVAVLKTFFRSKPGFELE